MLALTTQPIIEVGDLYVEENPNNAGLLVGMCIKVFEDCNKPVFVVKMVNTKGEWHLRENNIKEHIEDGSAKIYKQHKHLKNAQVQSW